MSKPKTGKAIMTDEEIIKEYDECHIAIEEVIKIAREQGRADLLAEQKFAKPCIDKFSELKAVADFKAKLLNYSKGNVVYGYSMKSRQIISDAIKEAEKK